MESKGHQGQYCNCYMEAEKIAFVIALNSGSDGRWGGIDVGKVKGVTAGELDVELLAFGVFLVCDSHVDSVERNVMSGHSNETSTTFRGVGVVRTNYVVAH